MPQFVLAVFQARFPAPNLNLTPNLAPNPVHRVKVDSILGNSPSKAPAARATSQIAACLFPGGHALTARDRSKMKIANQITAKDAKNSKISVTISGVPNTAVTTAAVTTVATNALFGVDSINLPFGV
jgi:hypothetical protein